MQVCKCASVQVCKFASLKCGVLRLFDFLHTLSLIKKNPATFHFFFSYMPPAALARGAGRASLSLSTARPARTRRRQTTPPPCFFLRGDKLCKKSKCLPHLSHTAQNLHHRTLPLRRRRPLSSLAPAVFLTPRNNYNRRRRNFFSTRRLCKFLGRNRLHPLPSSGIRNTSSPT